MVGILIFGVMTVPSVVTFRYAEEIASSASRNRPWSARTARRPAHMDRASANHSPGDDAPGSGLVLGGRDLAGAGTARAGLDLEVDLLATDEAIELKGAIEPVTVEEVLLAVLGSDEAKAAVGDNLLDGTCGHGDLVLFSKSRRRTAGSRRNLTTTRESPEGGRVPSVYPGSPFCAHRDPEPIA